MRIFRGAFCPWNMSAERGIKGRYGGRTRFAREGEEASIARYAPSLERRKRKGQKGKGRRRREEGIGIGDGRRMKSKW